MTLKIFVAGAITRSALHQSLISALHTYKVDTLLYEWTTPESPMNDETIQELYERPITIFTISQDDLNPEHYSSFLRRVKAIQIQNPTRLMLPLPIDISNIQQWRQLLVNHSQNSGLLVGKDILEEAVTLSALNPLQRDPKDISPVACLYIGQALIAQQHYEESLQYLLLSTTLQLYGAQATLAYAYAHLERWTDCVTICRDAINQSSGRAALFYCLGQGLNGLNQYEAAIPDFQRALALSPNLAGAWFGKGISLMHTQQYREALQSFEKGVAASPLNVWAYEHDFYLKESQHYIEELRRML